MKSVRASALGFALSSLFAGSILAAALPASTAHAEALLLVDADSGKVLRADNATHPWYPASTTKLMTLYMTLSAIRDQRITFDTLFTVSHNAVAQAPTKMGFPAGVQVTVDNALKMMMVKSANDMAVLLAEGIGGSIDNFAVDMTNTAHKLGMSETNYVNPNGLPADGQITSARDLAILARALIREFPEYSSYWHIPAIKFGRRVVRNYNPLLGRYPGANGMKTGFICASGFNLVATATRNNRTLIAVVLGAPSGAARAVKAAEMLESGFTLNPLAWLMPSLGSVDAMAPMDAAPMDLKDEICGRHRRRPATEDEDADAGNDNNGGGVDESSPQFATMLSAIRAPTPQNANLLADAGPVTPVVVYTGPTRTEAEIARLAALPPEAAVRKKGRRHKLAARKPTDVKVGKATVAGDKPKVTVTRSAEATPAPAAAAAPKKRAKPHPAAPTTKPAQ